MTNQQLVSEPRAVATGSYSISHFPFTIGHLEDSFLIAPTMSKWKMLNGKWQMIRSLPLAVLTRYYALPY